MKAFISFILHLGLHFLSFWHFRPSFGSFWPFGPIITIITIAPTAIAPTATAIARAAAIITTTTATATARAATAQAEGQKPKNIQCSWGGGAAPSPPTQIIGNEGPKGQNERK